MNQLKDVWPIRAGDRTLTGFSIHRNGRIYSGVRSLQAMGIRDAAKYWNRMSGPIWHELRDEKVGCRRPQRRKLKLADLIYFDRDRVSFNTETGSFEREPTPVMTTRWYFQDRTSLNEGSKTYLVPEDLPSTRGPGMGWYGLHIEGEYTTLVHGPSLASSVFGTESD